MFRNLKKRAMAHRERLVSLVLLPAFFLGTMPHIACICADGHREDFCKATLCVAVSSGSSNSASCGCSCCKSHGNQQLPSCCRAKTSQPTSGSKSPVNGVTA